MKSTRLFALTALAASAFGSVACAETYTSESYAQSDHLIAQWDGIDNAGIGVHDPEATVWKDLRGSLDMTLTRNGRWTTNGKALYMYGDVGAQGTTKTPAYKTIEIVYRMTDTSGRIMFCSGLASRFAIFDNPSSASKKLYFDGITSDTRYTKRIAWTWNSTDIVSAAATYDADTVDGVFLNGQSSEADSAKNGWNAGDGKVAVGGRKVGETKYAWFGEIYSIRLYDTVLSAEELAANRKIDEERFTKESTKESEQYVQDGLIVQWDGIDNVGTGVHDPEATVWKDLKGDVNLVLTNNAVWNDKGNGLVVNDISAVAEKTADQYEGFTNYRTIEVVYNRTSSTGRIMFNGGLISRLMVFDPWADNTDQIYFSGSSSGTICQWDKRCINAMSFLAARYDDSNHVTDISSDGAAIDATEKVNAWGASTSITIGGRCIDRPDFGTTRPWYGEVYAIRLYNRRLTRAELAHNNAIDRKRFLSLDCYRGCESIRNMWDGEHNFGENVAYHPTSPIWKDLRGSADLTLTTNGSWLANGQGLLVHGASATNKSAAAEYRTIEAAYRLPATFALDDKTTSIMFESGRNSRQMISCYDSGKTICFSGITTNNIRLAFSDDKVAHSVAAVYTNASLNAGFAYAAYADGVRGSKWYADGWALRNKYITIGDTLFDETNDRYRRWNGELYAIRLYNRELTATEISFNAQLDKKRIALMPRTVTWNGGDGDFGSAANWSGGVMPHYNDTAMIATGTATSREDQVVGSLSLGSGAAIALTLPATPGATPFTVYGRVAAENGAGLVLGAKAYGKSNPGKEITLIECDKDSSAALQTLADNVTFVNTSVARQGKVSVVDGKKLVYAAPQRPGMTLLVH